MSNAYQTKHCILHKTTLIIHAVIIDADPISRQKLHEMLSTHCPNVTVVAMETDVVNGVIAINKHRPDLVLMDVELPHYTGFKLVEFFEDVFFEIIITSFQSKFAQKAIKIAVFDYLLKPLEADKLKLSIQNLEARLKSKQSLTKSNLVKAPHLDKRYILPIQNGLLYLREEEIFYLESQGRYTHIHLADSFLITTRSLKECEVIFENSLLIRIHRSFVVNLQYITKYSKGRDSFVILNEVHKIDVGKNYKDELSKIITYFIK